MKYWNGTIAALLMVVLLAGCGKKMTEEQLRAKALNFENKEQWQEAAKTYEALVKKYPESKKIDTDLYKLGVIYANNLKDYDKSVTAYKKLVENYPKSSYAIQSTFMIGYRYANDIHDLDKAKAAYQEFLKKYPKHELASSVKWELAHLGQDLSEIELQLGSDSLKTAEK
ncbi:MAG: tetratricopeptide repeat protein [Calditrichaeota bacterium]|nr:tetratricopeptide repeat protein [Calditrichota bacterium]